MRWFELTLTEYKVSTLTTAQGEILSHDLHFSDTHIYDILTQNDAKWRLHHKMPRYIIASEAFCDVNVIASLH